MPWDSMMDQAFLSSIETDRQSGGKNTEWSHIKAEQYECWGAEESLFPFLGLLC